MNEPHVNPEEMLLRVNEVMKEIRKSELFPALLGGLAGGVAGALMATLIAGRATARRSDAPAATAHAAPAKPGFALQDLAQLAMVVVSLARQIQTFAKEQKK